MSRTAGATYEVQIDDGLGWGASIPVAGTSYDYVAPTAGTYAFQVRAVAAGYAPSAWVISKPLQLTATASFAGVNRITSYNVCYTKLLRLARARGVDGGV